MSVYEYEPKGAQEKFHTSMPVESPKHIYNQFQSLARQGVGGPNTRGIYIYQLTRHRLPFKMPNNSFSIGYLMLFVCPIFSGHV